MTDVETPPAGGDTELRASMSSADQNDLPDDAFAYIEPGGQPDAEGKTVPRSLRHFPIHDAAHVRNALARASQSEFGDKAMPKILAAAKKFGVDVAQQNSAAGRRRKPRHRAVPLLPEIRHFRADHLEIRSNTQTDEIVITGAPIVYDRPYTVTDMFGEFQERMMPGVADQVLGDTPDVRFLFNHDGLPLARTTAGTLQLADTATELRFTAVLDARQQLANDLAIAIERGDVTQMSCGFIVARDEWDDNMENRDIHQFADLLDVSAVTYPASPTTSIQIAQRMALEVPVASRARVRNMYAQLRAGKVLSDANAEKLADAAKALHSVLEAGGIDPTTLTADDDESTSDDDGTDIPEGGNVDGQQGVDDQTGTRSQTVVDPGEPVASRRTTLRLQLAARQHTTRSK